MRFRLLLVLSAFSVAAVAAFALPLLGSTAAERTQRFVLERTADMDRFAALAQQPAGSGTLTREVQAYTELYGEGVVVVDRTGSPIVESGLRAVEPGVAAAIDAALRNQPANRPDRLGPWSTEPLLLSRPVGTGTQVGGAVVLRASPAAAATDIAASWTVVLLGALTAAIVFAAVALAVARWVLRPVAELAGGVGAVAAGRPGAHVSPHAGPPELRELAAAFNRMSDAVSTSAEQQRRLVADTSHQLRNPLAALRLRVDTLEGHVGEAGLGTYRSTIAEVDRLEALLDGLLDLASAESRATDVAAGGGSGAAADVPVVVAEQVALWAPVAARAGVRLESDGGPVAEAACSASELAQVLDVLLDNAVKYAGGGATVQVGWTVCDTVGGVTLALTVRDDGPGIATADLPLATQRFWRSSRRARGSGLGLAIAEQLVGARDGRLRLDGAAGGGLQVRVELPCVP
ncbi:sensor histidine kinase [Pseudonocardia sp. TRM90224]|uniref:sensor histidine kinase n=1 Tax=Pseudonocardia sp. TRM90224 TaxID=2812678 RepID=UPI001E4553BF|nr:HAMP domain-containing sensor histidine kinase [Pseudonocardia sp. TRM90224]